MCPQITLTQHSNTASADKISVGVLMRMVSIQSLQFPAAQDVTVPSLHFLSLPCPHGTGLWPGCQLVPDTPGARSEVRMLLAALLLLSPRPSRGHPATVEVCGTTAAKQEFAK